MSYSAAGGCDYVFYEVHVENFVHKIDSVNINVASCQQHALELVIVGVAPSMNLSRCLK